MLAPRSRFNRVISAHRVVEGRRFPLEDIKAIRALAPGCKVNDVFLTIGGGAMRKYLLAKDDRRDKTLTAMAPISVRAKDEKGDMGNQVAAMVAPLGTHLGDPAERLQFVHSKTANSKAMTEAVGARNMTEASKVAPALWMSLGAQLYTRLGLANRGVAPMFSTVVTNVPGPPVPIYSTGARLESMMGLICLTDGMGLGHTVQSYVDEATVTFTACRDLMPDPEFYAQCMQDSFDELCAASAKAAKGTKAVAEGKPAARKAPAKRVVKGTSAARKRSPSTNKSQKKTENA